MGKVRVISGVLGTQVGDWVSYEDYKELQAQLEEEQLARRDYIPVEQANKDIAKAVELGEEILRKRIEQLQEQVDRVKALPDKWRARYEYEIDSTGFELSELIDCEIELIEALNGDHVDKPWCWCNPAQDDEEPTVWIHNQTALEGE